MRVSQEAVQSRLLGYMLMTVLICLVYTNSFEAAWHLDDFANIVYNKKHHHTDISTTAIISALHASPWDDNQLYRPVACLTFALNWFFGQQNVFGYHLINLVIHCFAAIFLMKAILLLFKTPLLSDRYKDSITPYWVALMATTLWAVHPIQTQAVTYIVQRMAQLAGLFSIVGIYCFLEGRLHSGTRKRIAWFFGAFLSFLFALGSKENAVIFPFSLALIEVVFFRIKLFSSAHRRIIVASLISGVILFGTVIALFLSEEFINTIFESYSARYFNHSERLLTEFRVLYKYLWQIFYPNPTQLSIEHDFAISNSLLTPWTTLPAVIGIFIILWTALYFIPQYPLLSFGVLFFLLQHTVESSILPLELVFEHRNYIPTMFLFAGIACGIYKVLAVYKGRNSLMYGVLVAAFSLALLFVSLGTYSRNADWFTEKSLWLDAISKSPNSSRALHNLAWGYYEPLGDAEKALSLYRKSLEIMAHRKDSSGSALHNIGNIYFLRKDYHTAIAYFEKSIDKNADNIKTHLRLVHSYIGLSEWKKAEEAVDRIIQFSKRNADINRLKGYILLNQKLPAEALVWFRRVLGTQSPKWEELAGIGQCLHLMGHYKMSDFFLRSAQSRAPNSEFLILNRLELYLVSGEELKAETMADKFVNSIPAGSLGSYIEKLLTDSSFYPLNYLRILPVIQKAARKASVRFEQLDIDIIKRSTDTRTNLYMGPLEDVIS